MITNRSIDRFLMKLQAAPNETLTAYTNFFEGLHPGEVVENAWQDITEEEAPQMRAAVRMGLVTAEFRHWTPEFPDEFAPDGGDYIISLSGLGTERLMAINEPFLRKAGRQVLTNIPTIIVSIVGAWCLSLLGPAAFKDPGASSEPEVVNTE